MRAFRVQGSDDSTPAAVIQAPSAGVAAELYWASVCEANPGAYEGGEGIRVLVPETGEVEQFDVAVDWRPVYTFKPHFRSQEAS